MVKPRSGLSAYALAATLVFGVACAEPAHTKDKEDPPSGVIARVGDRTFSLQEVDEAALALNAKAYQQLYNARRAALTKMLDEHLLSLEADARGVSTEDLLDAEIAKKSKAVTDADIETYYNQKKAQLRGKTMEQVGPQIRIFLENQEKAGARQRFLADLKKKHEVEIHLEPPRMEVTIAANDPAHGPADARVTIVEFSDFQ